MNNRVVRTGAYITKSTKYFLFTISVIVIILLGLLFCINEINTSIDEYTTQIENIAHVLSAGIPSEVFDRYDENDSFIADPLYNEVVKSVKTYITQNESVGSISVFIVSKDQLFHFIQAGAIKNPALEDEYEKVIEFSFKQKTDASYVPEFYNIGKNNAYISVAISNNDLKSMTGLLALEMSTDLLHEQIIQHLFLTIFIFALIITIYIGMVIALIKNRTLRDEKKKIWDSAKALKESEMLFRNIFEQAAIGISINTVNENLVTDIDSINVNASYERITGYTKEQLMKVKWTEITHDDFLCEEQKMMHDFLKQNINGYQLEKKILKADGTISWVNVIVSGLHLDNQEKQIYICIVEDIDNRKKMESSLIESEKDKSILISNMPGMAFRSKYNKDWTMEFVSSGCLELTGYTADRFTGENKIVFNQLIDPRYAEFVQKKWRQAVISKTKCSIEYEIHTASGQNKWVYEQGQAVYSETGEPLYIEGLIIDIDKSKKQELELRFLIDHNPMTGLFSKSYFHFILNREVEDGIIGKKAVILLNIRNFSLLNMTYGYTYAEEIIKELSTQLRLICANNCQIFHISIDRFVMYIKGYEDKQELVSICNRITAMVYRKFITRIVGGSMGVYEFDSYMADGDIVIRNASIAAENTDTSQVFSFMFFNTDMERKIIRKTIIEEELAKISYGDKKNRLYSMFQPIVRLADDSIAGFETLARFNSEILGNVPPSEFIPVAEEKQLIVALSKKIIRHALEFIMLLEKEGADELTVSVNISAIQLLREEFVGDIIDLVQEYAISPDKLVLEITESMLAQNYSEINDKLSLLQNAGFRIAIDDFGTGYSSLARESELNVNYIKIDKYFIDKLLLYDEDQVVTSEIISMSHKLGHYVVAEGIEYSCQKEYLMKYNCDFIQGYLFSKPLSMSDAILLIKKNHPDAYTA